MNNYLRYLAEDHTTLLHKSKILLDTNVLINFFSTNTAYLDLFKLLSECSCKLGVLRVCVHEFLKASSTEKVYDDKLKFIQEFGIAIVDPEFEELDIRSTICELHNSKSRLPIADLYIMTYMQKYSHIDKFFLLTEDISDFTTDYFQRSLIFNVEHTDKIQNIIFTRWRNVST